MNMLVTAGPTREAIDPVRFLSNRSSGKMGFAVAAAGAAAGYKVRLIAGPVALPTPPGVERVDVVSAAEMYEAVSRQVAWCDALVMAAAVADWRPAVPAAHKLKKSAATLHLELVRTVDILTALKPVKGARVFVGFAAETGDPAVEAARKLAAKGLDMIVANDVSRADAGFEVDTNAVTLIEPGGTAVSIATAPKSEIARAIVAWISRRTQCSR